jgi:DivIVA domain-containing protein
VASESPVDKRGKDTSRTGRYRSAPPGRAAQAARDVDFPVVLRGYDREAVDRYVEEVNQVIAELEISSSPASAVRHALAEVSEETRGLLQQAHETADEITTRSRSQADDRLQRAEREAEDVRAAAAREADATRAAIALEGEGMRAAAEARVQELAHNAEAIAQERQRLIDNMNAIASRLAEITAAEAARFPDHPAEAATPTAELPDGTEPQGQSPTDEPTASDKQPT